MLKRLSYRVNATLERYLPEQRLFLKSDATTRFIRLHPATQALGIAGFGFMIAWTILASAILMMDSIGAGDGRAQALRQQSVFEKRLTALSNDRNLRAEEVARAQDRFTLALSEVSAMQARLLESEDARKELETGIEVIQNTLRRTIRERDGARAEASALSATLKSETGSSQDAGERTRDTVATLALISDALAGTAAERDEMTEAALVARNEVAKADADKRATAVKTDAIFAKLESAVTVSMEPLDNMFRSAGLSPDDLLKSIKRGYSSVGTVSTSTSGAAPTADDQRANTILQGLDRMNLYRIAAEKTPFAIPVKSAFRFTSGFGYRHDPKGAGTRMHEGTDFASSTGTPIYATADGVVSYADWDNGYGRLIKIQHEFGLETRYGHLSQIRVSVGQRVSRGDRIGDMGSSGRSTGTHLHYEVRSNGTAVNPMTFIKAGKDVF